VLIHQREPSAMIRRAAAVVRPGGIVAFLEPALHLDGHSLPEIELVNAAAKSLKRFMLAALPSPDVAGRLIPCFIEAGLPEPKVLWESVVPGSKDDIWLRSFVLTYKNFLSLMQRFCTVDPRVGDPDTLAERIIADVIARRAQGVTGPFASAWAIKAYPCLFLARNRLYRPSSTFGFDPIRVGWRCPNHVRQRASGVPLIPREARPREGRQKGAATSARGWPAT
jgi:hypothetical protein